MPKGIVHDTQVGADDECVTLCLFHTDRSGKSLLVGAVDAADRFEMNRLDLSSQEAEAAVALCRQVLQSLDRERSSKPAIAATTAPTRERSRREG